MAEMHYVENNWLTFERFNWLLLQYYEAHEDTQMPLILM